jgi:hypothetical protein
MHGALVLARRRSGARRVPEANVRPRRSISAKQMAIFFSGDGKSPRRYANALPFSPKSHLTGKEIPEMLTA